MCQNSPFNEFIFATTICSEDEFSFIKVSIHPLTSTSFENVGILFVYFLF